MYRLVVLATLAVTLILGGCGSGTFVRQPAGWKTIEIRAGLSDNYDEAWQTTVDTIARNYDIEIMDKDSGYLRTAWKYGILGQSSNAYAGRIAVKFPKVETPTKVDMKTDAKQFNRFMAIWEEGFDSRFERDVFDELSGRLGRTTQ